jgi:hypothetical protein
MRPSPKERERLRQRRIVFPPTNNAVQALNAVQQWAAGCVLLRETGVFRNGRMDGVLVRTHFNSVLKEHGLYGIEVKLSRSDFLAGLKNGQFDRYVLDVNGLYIATAVNVCKTSEIPKQFGHLVVHRRDHGLQCVCRRHARFKKIVPLDEDLLWRLLVDCCDQFQQQERNARHAAELELHRISVKAGDRIARMLRELK